MKTRTLILAINVAVLVFLALLFPTARVPLALVSLLIAGNFYHLSSDSSSKVPAQKSPLDNRGQQEIADEGPPIELVDLLKNIANSDGVILTDTQVVTAYSGIPCPDYSVGEGIPMPRMTRAMEKGETQILRNKRSFDCRSAACKCSFTSGVLVPLQQEGQITGSLGFFRKEKGGNQGEFIQTCEALARLVSLQMKHTELERQVQLTTEARLDALQAQVNPHFLFNSLNAINMYVLKDPKVTRELIRRLSSFLRYTLGNTDRFTTVGDELHVVQDYLIIEKARFGDRLVLVMDVEERLKTVRIPILSIQPLVNNAIIHGLLPKEGNGLLRIRIRKIYDEMEVSVVDNGVGIPEEKMDRLYEKGVGSGLGVGIHNVHERLKLLYGNDHGLTITSTLDQGTNVTFKIPLSLEEGVDNR